MTSRNYSSDAKEVNILIVVRCFKIEVKLGGVKNCDIWEKVRCSFNSFEQCILRDCCMSIAVFFITFIFPTKL